MENELALIKEIKSGNKSAYKVIFEKYYSQLTHFALLYVKDTAASEEIVQEFFVQFWIKRHNVQINTSVKSYLYRAIRNRAINYLRDSRNDLSIEYELETIDKTSTCEINIEIDYKEIKKSINKAVESLPDKCKNIFKLSREEELTYKQIAEKLNISQKTVENQIGIALNKLREKLQPILKSLISLFIFISIK